MIRSELITKISEEHNLTDEEAAHAVDVFFETIQIALEERRRVELRGFGAFGTKLRNARQGRNPRNGETVSVPAKYVPFFKTGRPMHDRLNPAADKDDASA